LKFENLKEIGSNSYGKKTEEKSVRGLFIPVKTSGELNGELNREISDV
jgi:hypothetical protein